MHKITFIQYFPPYIEGYEPRIAEYTNTESLLKDPKVLYWATTPKFYRFSQTKRDEGFYLVAEMDKGRDSYVVGISDVDLNLPEWIT